MKLRREGTPRPVDLATERELRDLKRRPDVVNEVAFILPDWTSGLAVHATHTHTWTTISYPAGGEPADPTLPGVPNLKDVVYVPKNGYTFQYTAPNVEAYTAPGVEATGTNMASAVGSMVGIVVGARDPAHTVFKTNRVLALVSVEIEFAADVAVDSVNGWTLHGQVVNAAGDVYELGRLESRPKGFLAATRYPVFRAEGPSNLERMRPGDELRIYVQEHGSASALVAPVLYVRRRRP